MDKVIVREARGAFGIEPDVIRVDVLVPLYRTLAESAAFHVHTYSIKLRHDILSPIRVRLGIELLHVEFSAIRKIGFTEQILGAMGIVILLSDHNFAACT